MEISLFDHIFELVSGLSKKPALILIFLNSGGKPLLNEPEIQALRNALDKYRPRIYLNTHLGSSYMMYHSDTSFEAEIQESIVNNSQQLNVTPYSMRRGIGGGMIASDADESFGASGWLLEIEAAENLPNILEGFLERCYPRVFAIFLAFNQAVTLPSTNIQPSNRGTPSDTIPSNNNSPSHASNTTPSPTPSSGPDSSPTPSHQISPQLDQSSTSFSVGGLVFFHVISIALVLILTVIVVIRLKKRRDPKSTQLLEKT
jgi:hypothetical protein